MGSVLRRVGASLLLTGVLGWTSAGVANPAAAEALFREGRKLLDQGQLEEACAKLAESHRLDASPGALGSLAQCHEKQGKIATAWAEYLAAFRLATAQGKQAQAQVTRDRAAALEPRLIYLTIKVQSPAPGFSLQRDGQPVSASALDTRIPVDPGSTLLEAEAPGHEPVQIKLSLEEGKTENVVAIPPLRKKEAPAAPVASGPPSGAPSSSSAPPLASSASRVSPPSAGEKPGAPVAGYVLGGASIVALGVGGFFGLSSLADYREAERDCPSRVGCSRRTLETRDRADAKAWGANVGIGVGLVGVALSTYLLFFRKEEPRVGALRVDGSVARDGAGFQLRGAF
ncbi:MAG: hypothetical protein MUF64_25890 [Polyangiaceae bacterium]|nr:hypothetical protein [Polyangiaceae bacterium]